MDDNLKNENDLNYHTLDVISKMKSINNEDDLKNEDSLKNISDMRNEEKRNMTR